MADMKDFEPKNCNPTEDWTVVVPRHSKQRRRNFPKIKTIEQQQPWAPTDLEINLEKELDLMQICITKLEKSIFYHSIVNQIQTSEVLDNFHKVLASESEMQMVIYGIGNIKSYETPRLQLALAILIKRNFDWVRDIEVFDPVLSTTECAVLKALGCSVLSVNEQGRRQALKPTMFLMPHCEAVLYDNLLQVNWGAVFLNRIVLFGNLFSKYESFISEFKNSVICDSLKHVINVCRYSSEKYIQYCNLTPLQTMGLNFFHQSVIFFLLIGLSASPIAHANDLDIISDFIIPPNSNGTIDENFFMYSGMRGLLGSLETWQLSGTNHAAVAAFASANIGTFQIPLSVFTTGIDDDVLAKSFKTDAETIQKIKDALAAKV
ncbi:hypothetical protein GIB67_036426 [Kingdonia uniflora]|uniref:SRR1-like domain-containing protein n=1 Tax=Kingdonia uniflora TaxID=39325 RepID=A0A7J7L491_9MAGN|nr:hypothetical protein GIB67_036426 [Kingdonia uniflora]